MEPQSRGSERNLRYKFPACYRIRHSPRREIPSGLAVSHLFSLSGSLSCRKTGLIGRLAQKSNLLAQAQNASSAARTVLAFSSFCSAVKSVARTFGGGTALGAILSPWISSRKS